jgi:hypothetical protein
MRTIIAILFCLIYLSCISEPNTIKGKIINPFENQSHWINITLRNLDSTYTEIAFTDSLGYFEFNSLKNDNYVIYIFYAVNILKDTIEINNSNKYIEITYPECSKTNTKGICPICHQQTQIQVDSYILFDHFFKSKREERIFYRERKRKGYEINMNKLTWIKNKKQYEKFGNDCFNWFCIKDKFIF